MIDKDIFEERFEKYPERITSIKKPSYFEDKRTEFEKDYSRIVHSASFRRLQGKTQILNLGDSDFYRTRLTHSLEVAQIARSLSVQLKQDDRYDYISDLVPDEQLVQVISLAHDIGHPPFGHGGEIALNYCMRDDGGFEGNAHTLRILSRLEKFSAESGANLTRRALLGTLKYPVSYSMASNPDNVPCLNDATSAIQIIDRHMSEPPKCYFDTEQDVIDWALEPFSMPDRNLFQTALQVKPGKHKKAQYKSFDCSIMDLADDIAYGVHDLEDAIALKLISRDRFFDHIDSDAIHDFLSFSKGRYDDEFKGDLENDKREFIDKLFADDSGMRKRQIGRLVNYFITHYGVTRNDDFEHDLLAYKIKLNEKSAPLLGYLKKAIYTEVISSPNVQHLEFKGQKMVVSVFEALLSEPDKFLPRDHFELYKANNDKRVICDYIAGMTDSFLLKTYDRLFSPRMGSVFDKL